MKLGTQTICITPPKPKLLGGYGVLRPFSGVHDDLRASIFVLDDHVFIGLDLVGIDEAFVKQLRKSSGMASLHVFASHTHSGPAGTLHTDGPLKYMNFVFQDYDESYMVWLHDKLVSSIELAKHKQEPCTLSFNSGEAQGFATNRIDPSRYHETRQFGFEFEFKDGKRCLMHSYPCHPTVLNYQNTLISRDLVGASTDYLEQSYHATLFMNGSCADISTRFTRKEASFAEVMRLGTLAGQGIEAMMANANDKKSDIVIKHHTFVSSVLIREDRRYPLEISILWFDQIAFVFIPAEFSSLLAQKIQKQTGAYVVSMANGYLGYCVEAASFEEGSYESSMSMLKVNEIEKTVTKLIKEIHNGKH